MISVDRPVTYLYNTLHYYESKLRDRPSLKHKLVYAVLGSLCETRGCWTLSESYQRYNIQTPSSTNTNSMGTNTDVLVTPAAPIWVPDLEYYVMLVKRITDSILLLIKSCMLFSYIKIINNVILQYCLSRNYCFLPEFTHFKVN